MSRRKFTRAVRVIEATVHQAVAAENERRAQAVAELALAIEKFAAASHGQPLNFARDVLGLVANWLPETVAPEEDIRRLGDLEMIAASETDPALACQRLVDFAHQQVDWLAATGRLHPDGETALEALPPD